jgi:hypothetical protein
MGTTLKYETLVCVALILLLILPNEPFLIFFFVFFVGSGLSKRYNGRENRFFVGILHNLGVVLAAILIELFFLFSSAVFLHSLIVFVAASTIYSLGQRHLTIRLLSLMVFAPIVGLLCLYLVENHFIIDEAYSDIMGIGFLCIKVFDLIFTYLVLPKFPASWNVKD